MNRLIAPLGLLFSVIIWAVILGGALALSGCSTLSNTTQSIGTQYLTIKLIESGPESEHLTRANFVVTLTTDAIRYVEEGTLPLDEIQAKIEAQIPWQQLDTAEIFLVNEMIRAVRIDLEDHTVPMQIDESLKYQIIAVLSDIRAGAQVKKLALG